ncbi:hypothetical protein A1O1_05750 [Capronia coronata CBS 617.96]|uniref:MINDY deubiquitinase domain-containing protein n=1 Tax=Capronia coronata CBS 617.96 TaxID=1182541 RepID=W9Y842_9EURO|nr:uncharacterized protein A1O1_05750 [Capronia coronata CBS 617.96]EXJ85386.1 hypothetical protein A1O1_05750 [Capronia coronata CBS 617.96]
MSLPYPASPPRQPSFSADSQHTGSVPASADVYPIPPSTQRHTDPQGTFGFQSVENPWFDAPANELRSDRPLPDILRPGPPRTAEDSPPAPGSQPQPNVPQILRAGRSQEDTPRSSLDSQRSKDFWEDSDEEEQEEGGKSPLKPGSTLPLVDTNRNSEGDGEPPERSPGIRRKPVGTVSPPQPSRPSFETASQLASNNPFRRPSSSTVEDGMWGRRGWERQESETELAKGKEPDRGDASYPTSQLQSLSFATSGMPDFSAHQRPEEAQTSAGSWAGEKQVVSPPMPQAPPPPPPAGRLSPFSKQPPLIPVSPAKEQMENPWASNLHLVPPTPSPIPFSPSQKQVSNYTEELLDREQESGAVSLGDELATLPNAVHLGSEPRDEPSLLDSDGETGPPLPTRPIEQTSTDHFDPPDGPPPPKPPRPLVRTTAPSEEEVARMVEQRSETYQIKHFNWFDHHSRKLRRSAMLTQNKNGPCPLLALVNALILGAKDASQAALDNALRSREQVTLGLIIETLMDELLSRAGEAVGQSLPDVDELNEFLMRLRTGMNANPRFVPASTQPPNLMDLDDSGLQPPEYGRSEGKHGTFESTTDMKLYAAFSVPLVHGWLPEPGSDAARAFARSAPTYEDAQALLFGEEELEYKLSNQGLSQEEQNLWEDINSIKNFLKTYPTQLTPTGLEAVRESLSAGSFAIMFRNDHFSTVYKHPESAQIFTLITDAGYADRDEIIWESLVDISGQRNEFFSGDFMPVSHNAVEDEESRHPAARRSSQLLSAPGTGSVAPLSPQQQQEQHDADFAMALQLQEEEEQRQRAERNRRRSSANPPGNNSQRRPAAATPVSRRPQAEARPVIPPRTSHTTNPGVNRPADALVDDAPPAYEEAAKGRPYIPPVGSPLHPSADPSPMASNTQLSGTISHTSASTVDPHPPGPNAVVGRRHAARRTSAYNETAQYYGPQRMQGLDVPQGAVGGDGGGPSRPGNMQRPDRDCIVM